MSDDGASSRSRGVIEPGRPIQTHLARLLLALGRGRRTGVIRVVARPPAEPQTQLVVVDGRLVFAESPSDARLLLERLLERRLLEPALVEAIAERAARERSWSPLVRLSELVVTEGRLEPALAEGLLAEAVEERVLQVLRVLDGEWLYGDDPRARAVERFPVALERLVLTALAEDGIAALFERELERYGHLYPKLESGVSERTTSFGLTPGRFRTLRSLDGAHTLASILDASPLGRRAAAALIAGLTILERIRWSEASAASAPPKPSGAPATPQPEARTFARMATSIEHVERAGASPARRSTTPGERGERAAMSPDVIRELLRRGSASASGAQRAEPPSRLSAHELWERGKLHLASSRLALASTDFAEAHALEPADSRYELHLRFAEYLQQGDHEAREPIARRLLALAHTRARGESPDPFALHALGRLAFDAGDEEKAKRAFAAADRLAPGDVETVRYLRLLAARAKPKR